MIYNPKTKEYEIGGVVFGRKNLAWSVKIGHLTIPINSFVISGMLGCGEVVYDIEKIGNIFENSNLLE